MEGKVRIAPNYLDRVHMVGYPSTPSDASIKISELRSNDTGVYRCEVQHGIEDNHDTVHVYIKGILTELSTARMHVLNSFCLCISII